MATASHRRAFLRAAGGAPLSRGLDGPGRSKGSAQPPLKVGQIGGGHAHAARRGVYRRSPDYEVVGLVEPDPALRRRAEGLEVYRGLPWMTREQLLNAPGLRAVLVETRVR